MFLRHAPLEGEIVVQQVDDRWQVVQRNRPDENFKNLDEAVARALVLFREQHLLKRRIVVLPADNAAMLQVVAPHGPPIAR